jgi:hypothetical protein
MSKLKSLLSSVYKLSDEEASIGADSLVKFFKELHKINTRLEQEKLIEEESNNFNKYETKFDENQDHKS